MSTLNNLNNEYDFPNILSELRKQQNDNAFYCQTDDDSKPRYYSLGMFPYPSGNAHMGHVRVYTIVDIVARYRRLKGNSVLNPLGWDSFGLPAENAAIKNKVAPDKWTELNIKAMRNGQFPDMGWSFDLSKEINTSSPEYYRWTQWIFLQFLKHGKAYRAKSLVNWCPVDQTVLANEQVIDGLCWRDGAPIEKRPMEQWFLKITDYADRLWNDIGKLKNWSTEAVAVQRNWINKSYGSKIVFECPDIGSSLSIFTTRADTLFGVVALVISPEHPLMKEILEKVKQPKLSEYVEDAIKKSAVERMASKEKTGVPTGLNVFHPLTGKATPLWVGDYVLGDYGTGVVMCVPAHDERDYEFAKKYALPIIQVIQTKDGAEANISKTAFTDEGVLINSGKFSSLKSDEARDQITEELERLGKGEKMVTFNLRDWSVGRQRYWGCPIPVIYCDKCGVVPVPEDQLPVILPANVSFEQGKADIKSNTEFVHTTCPKCAAPAKRETDTLDTFMCSSWYAFRFIDPKNATAIFNSNIVNKWMPINFYVGGLEHAAQHMIYFRFFTKFFFDIGLINFDEPVDSFFCNGMVTKDGSKMSKSKGNVVVPTDIISQHGADALRLYIMSDTPANYEMGWDDSGINTKVSFIKRSYRALFTFMEANADLNISSAKLEDFPNQEALRNFCLSFGLMEQNIEQNLFHNAVARLHEITNFLMPILAQAPSLSMEQKNAVKLLAKNYLIASSLFVPFFAEFLFKKGFGNTEKFSELKWPEFDKKFQEQSTVNIVVQINGKKRAVLVLPKDAHENQVKEAVLNDKGLKQIMENKAILKSIYVHNKIYNIVLGN